MRSVVAGHWELTTTNWNPSLKLILLQLHKKLPKNSASTILWSFSIWSKLERWKSSIRGCLMNWPPPKKILILKCHLHLFYATMNHFLIRLWPVTKSELYMTTGDNQLSGEKESREEKTKGLEEQLIKLLQRFRTETIWGKVPQAGGASRPRLFLILDYSKNRDQCTWRRGKGKMRSVSLEMCSKLVP